MRRTLSQLIDLAEPGWPIVQEWIAKAVVRVEILPRSERADAELEALQVTTRSPMGAITHACGGLLLDDGWLKILGGGDARLPWTAASLTRELGFWPDPDEPPSLLIVAVDVLGGVFAIDGGVLGARGHVHFFAPDDPEWLDCDEGYSGWVSACMNGALAELYAELRWSGWQQELAALAPDQGIHIHPPPWSRESKPLERTSRRAVPLRELLHLTFAATPKLLH